ncbi:ABC transporter substrate-binding protein [Croceibacterium mercuriale]|uniref:ABC transporter substrate-binding protein n=1 Tax=Croceibacterium mercuriale TaxID=1572751 RepID=A0A0B2C171_9SPHN|nr:penicillin-binding protein activator [Croceibacterium mercuriale]KHL25925.1 ABC transporter substrate-binding protein [Croceibacterium mercuriale]
MLALIRRGLAALLLTLFLAACQVIPDAGRGPVTTAPPPEPEGPSEGVLPTDDARHRVAILVPLSGDNATVGRAIANAATMALIDTNAQGLRITSYDTAEGAAAAAARALDDGNRVILGPLLAADVAPVAAAARPAGVPLITFSNDSAVAAADVFVMGHVPEQSVARTVGHAMQQGTRRFAALVPRGEYGDRTAAALARSVSDGSGTLVASERYDRGNTSIVSAAGRLRAAGGFDAVLIADGARLSALAAGALVRGEVRPNLLGTELWSGESAIANASAMNGAWFSAVSDERFRQFVTSYRSRFGDAPPRIATLGYDAVLLALRVARDWRHGTAFPVAALRAPDGFLGLDGPFRFGADGVGERAMEVRQVGDGTITVIDAAPARF